MPLEISVSRSSRALALDVVGDVDMSNSPQLAEALAHAAERAGRVELDLGAVRFIDSSGVRVLIGARNALAERGGRLLVTGVSPAVRRVLELTRLADGLLSGPRPLTQGP